MSHISCFYDDFSSYCASFSLMTSLTMVSFMMNMTVMVLGPGYLVHALFHFLKNMLVVSVAEDLAFLVDSQKYCPAQNIEFLS